MRTNKLYFPVLLAVILALSACASPQPNRPDSRMRDGLLGTVITISIHEKTDGSVFDEIFGIIEDIDRDMSVTNPSSEVSRINMAAGREAVEVTDAAYEVIDRACQISGDSGGAFDMTVEPLVSLWGIGTANRVPADAELREALKLVGYNDVVLDAERKSVYLSKEGMEITLGAIAKGYAGDMAAAAVTAHGIKSAILDLGGNIVTVGSRPDGEDWRIGIKTPIPGGRGNAGILRVSGKAVVTSGGYERYFEHGGKIYHHLLDPYTGYPAQSGLLSVTIVSGSSTEADMLSTAAFVLGYERGRKLVEAYGAEAVFITDEKTVYITDGLKNSFSLSNDEFSMAAVH